KGCSVTLIILLVLAVLCLSTYIVLDKNDIALPDKIVSFLKLGECRTKIALKGNE
ncbi:hypothetical protein HMI54_003297, partial [Coelomomyces lativittatus]